MENINSTRDLIKRYNELHPGKHWFDEDTMDFFNTEIEYVQSDGFFITSERMELEDPKRYSIRQLTDKPEQVITHGEFCGFDRQTVMDVLTTAEKIVIKKGRYFGLDNPIGDALVAVISQHYWDKYERSGWADEHKVLAHKWQDKFAETEAHNLAIDDPKRAEKFKQNRLNKFENGIEVR
jgi:hypothetical protein